MNCMKSFGEASGPNMKSSPIGSQKIKIGNLTESCPGPMNKSDVAMLDSMCGSVKQLLKCSDSCPDDMVKNLSSIGLIPMKFMCVDKFEDIKKYMPCLSETCPDIQRTCVPKCGSVNALTAKFKSIGGGGSNGNVDDPDGAGDGGGFGGGLGGGASSLFEMLSSGGGSKGSSSSAGGNPTSMSEITRAVGDMCTAIDCHVNCSKAPILAKCGKEAVALSEDLVKMIVDTLDRASIVLGFKDMIPDKCKPLMAHVQQTAPVAAGMTTTSTSKNETVSKMTQLGASTKCEKPPCKSSGGVPAVPSMLLLFMVFVFVKGSKYFY